MAPLSGPRTPREDRHGCRVRGDRTGRRPAIPGLRGRTIGVRYTPEKGGPTDEVLIFDEDDLQDALARTDYLVLACPLTETTRGLIGNPEFATLTPEAVLVTVGRGPLVDIDALVRSLQRQRLRGAAIDVTDPGPLPEDHVLWTL